MPDEPFVFVRAGREISTSYPFTDLGRLLDALLKKEGIPLKSRAYDEAVSSFIVLERQYRSIGQRSEIRYVQQIQKPNGNPEKKDEHYGEFNLEDAVWIREPGRGYWHIATDALLKQLQHPKAESIDIVQGVSFDSHEFSIAAALNVNAPVIVNQPGLLHGPVTARGLKAAKYVSKVFGFPMSSFKPQGGRTDFKEGYCFEIEQTYNPKKLLQIVRKLIAYRNE